MLAPRHAPRRHSRCPTQQPARWLASTSSPVPHWWSPSSATTARMSSMSRLGWPALGPRPRRPGLSRWWRSPAMTSPPYPQDGPDQMVVEGPPPWLDIPVPVRRDARTLPASFSAACNAGHFCVRRASADSPTAASSTTRAPRNDLPVTAADGPGGRRRRAVRTAGRPRPAAVNRVRPSNGVEPASTATARDRFGLL